MNDPNSASPQTTSDRRTALDSEQSLADADQTLSDSDQTFSDSDQTASDSDQQDSAGDQRASDRDQATANKEHAALANPTGATEEAFDESREEREAGTSDRQANRSRRSGTARTRDSIADERDDIATRREEVATARGDEEPAPPERTDSEELLIRELRDLRAAAAADRARAAADRARAAQDRAEAARERQRLENELRSAHLDDLTGAMRREAGRLALEHEINRARRTDGRFVLAFVDIDLLKDVNDRQGHAAGDRVLQAVVQEIASRFRSFDPIVRYGGDEFICGISGIDREEAERRFAAIGDALHAAVGVKFSLGLAELDDDDTVDTLTERADAAMLVVKAQHHSRAGAART